MGSGLTKLATALLHQAIDNLTDRSAEFAELLDAGVGVGSPPARWLVARHLAVSVLGEAAVYTRLGELWLAVLAVDRGLAPLRRHARGVFDRTVGAEPGAFLMPALAEHRTTLEAVAELYRQAGHAGVLEDGRPATAADVFEAPRGRLGQALDPVLLEARRVQRLRVAFAEASAAVEEVNRLQGVGLVIGRNGDCGRDYTGLTDHIVREVEARRPADGTRFAVFPPPAGRAGPARVSRRPGRHP